MLSVLESSFSFLGDDFFESDFSLSESLSSSLSDDFLGADFFGLDSSLSNGDDFLSRIEFKEISKDEYETLDKVFGGEFGIFISEDYLQNVLDGDNENYNDDDYNDDKELDKENEYDDDY
jgi:hypothetical protein